MPLLRRGSRLGRATASPRRLTAWIPGTGGTTVLTTTDSIAAFLGSAVQPTVEGLTIIRNRGELVLALCASSAIASGFRGAFGIGIATLAAVTAGIASVPTPITEADAENWLYHRFFTLTGCDAIAGGAALDEELVHPVTASLRIDVDSKAMRKFPSEMALYAAIEVVESGTCTMTADWNSRALVKLP